MPIRTSFKAAACMSSLALIMTLGACSSAKHTAQATAEPATSSSSTLSSARATQSTEAAQVSTVSGGINSGCTLPDGDQSIPNTAPKVDEWVNIDGVGVPTSATFGPQKRQGDLYGCYAHSPTGALFAMTYFMAGAGHVDGFYEAWLTPDVLENLPPQNRQTTSSSGSATLRGFRITSATKDEVVADLVWDITSSDSTMNTIVQRYIATWETDHWVLDPKMFDTPVTIAPKGLDGFTEWSTVHG